MNYEFYPDVFFVTNFYLDFLAAYAVGEILQRKKKIARYLICCGVSSLAGCILFLKLQNYDLYLLCVHFIVNPGMVIAIFFPAEKGIYGKAFCLMYFVLLLLGGSVEWMYLTVAGGRFYELCLLLSAAPIMLFLFILRRKRKNVQHLYQVQIVRGETEIFVQALYDTGNSLLDPYVRKPVHIVSKETYEKLGGSRGLPVRLIPFSSVGCENGVLGAFTVDCIRVEEEDAEIEISPAVLAAAKESLFADRAYQMILNESIFGQERNTYVHKNQYTETDSV